MAKFAEFSVHCGPAPRVLSPREEGRTLWDSLPGGILTGPQCMGEELLHSPTPIGQGPRRGAYIVGYYEIIAGVEVDGLRRRPNMRTSQNSVKAKFAFWAFSEVAPAFVTPHTCLR